MYPTPYLGSGTGTVPSCCSFLYSANLAYSLARSHPHFAGPAAVAVAAAVAAGAEVGQERGGARRGGRFSYGSWFVR